MNALEITSETSYADTRLLIDGKWIEGNERKRIAVINPANLKRIGYVAKASQKDLERAALAAEKGWYVWAAMPAVERALIMRRAAALLRERVKSIAVMMTMEQGKPLAEAEIEVASAASIVEWFADEGMRIYGRIIPARLPHTQVHARKFPVGPVAAFTPWNFPINQVVRKLSAALASGCSFLLKAPEETPASPAALIQTFVDAGIPAGVVGLVFGDPAEVSNFLISHPAIQKITFTGSTQVGKQLASLAGAHMKRSTMELGGHAPVIVAEDADVAKAVANTMAGKYRNAGQVCIAPTRILVHRSLVEQFVEEFATATLGLKVADGLSPDATMGPLANERRVVAMQEMVKDAVKRGGVLRTGGQRMNDDGYFFEPTVIADAPLDSMVFNSEPFGPLAAIRSFDRLEEAIGEANRLPYGLAAYAFTSSIATVHALSDQLQAGMLWVNQTATPFPEIPFGGVKDSGYGSEGGIEALEPYLTTKSVIVRS